MGPHRLLAADTLLTHKQSQSSLGFEEEFRQNISIRNRFVLRKKYLEAYI